MAEVTIRCPHCGFSRKVPAAKIPPGAMRATCPQCRQGFALPAAPSSPSSPEKPSAPPAPAAEGKKPPETPRPAASASPPPRPPVPPAGAAGRPAPATPASGQAPPPVRQPPRRRTLSPVGELFDQTWALYKRRFGTLILVYLAIVGLVLAPVAVLAAIGFLLGGSAKGVAFLVLAGLFLVPLAAAWGGAAFTCAVVDETVGFGEAFARGRRLLLPFVWVFTLLGFLITGGYLLLIVPGILFTLWFFFANYIVAAEKSRGMAALLKSREYVRGFGWAVFGRLFLVSVIGSVLGAIPFVGPILSILFTPYFMLWMFLVYRELREIKGEPPFACGAGAKASWLVRGAAGYVVFPLLLLALFGPKLYWLARDLASGNWFALAAPGIEFKLPGGDPQPDRTWNAPAMNETPAVSETIRPAEFPLLYGSWSGNELGGGGGWQFAFDNGGYGVTVQAPDGSWLQGEATIHFDIGERDGSIRVPPGWGILDVDVASSSNGQGGQVALGAFTVTGDALKLCLGEPGGMVRAEAFAPAAGIRCFELARTQGTAGTPDYQFPTASGEAPAAAAPDGSAPAADFSDISIFAYVANYNGRLRINGRDVEVFGGERDMQYNYNQMGREYFRSGENIIEVEYEPIADLPPDHWLLEIHLKIKRGDTVLGDWLIKEKGGGSQRYSVVLD